MPNREFIDVADKKSTPKPQEKQITTTREYITEFKEGTEFDRALRVSDTVAPTRPNQTKPPSKEGES